MTPAPIYLSFDVETTGPCPGLHALVTLGVRAYDGATLKRLHEVRLMGNYGVPDFYEGIFGLDLDGPHWDPDTYTWWHDFERRDASAVTFGFGRPLDRGKPYATHAAPARLVTNLCLWVQHLRSAFPDRRHVWLAYPAAFDMAWLIYYARRYAPNLWKQVYHEPRNADDEGQPLTGTIYEGITCLDLASFEAGRRAEPAYPYIRSRTLAEHYLKDVDPQLWEQHGPEHTALADAVRQGELFMAMLREQRDRADR